MRRNHSLRFEALEARKLLTTAHVVVAKPLTPLDVSGTLAVNVNDSSQTQNLDGSWTTTVPVAGSLAGLGKVKGYWETSIDQLGNYLGPDQIILQSKTPKGAFTIAFNNVNSGKPTKASPQLGFYQHAQHLVAGSGGFAHATESGSIELMVPAKKSAITSIVLITVPPSNPATS